MFIYFQYETSPYIFRYLSIAFLFCSQQKWVDTIVDFIQINEFEHYRKNDLPFLHFVAIYCHCEKLFDNTHTTISIMAPFSILRRKKNWWWRKWFSSILNAEEQTKRSMIIFHSNCIFSRIQKENRNNES